MAFDKTKPAAGTDLDASNPELLANFVALEAVLGSGTLSAGLTIIQGNILYGSAGNTFSVLAPGTDGYYLKAKGAGANPEWATITGFGTWASKSVDTVYQASTDGFVTVYGTASSSATWSVYTDSSTPPTTRRARVSGGNISSGIWLSTTTPVKKDDYYKVTDAGSPGCVIFWLPLGA